MSGEMRPYVVRQGDYLTKLAFVHGFDVDEVWGHEKNKELAELRKDHNILAPGDVISRYWKDPPAAAPIERYEMDGGKSPAANKMPDTKLPKLSSLPLWDAETDWNKVLDPDGS